MERQNHARSSTLSNSQNHGGKITLYLDARQTKAYARLKSRKIKITQNQNHAKSKSRKIKITQEHVVLNSRWYENEDRAIMTCLFVLYSSMRLTS
jgi:hypothetical protein